MIQIEITDVRTQLPPEDPRLREAVRTILERESIAQAEISVAVVDDETICTLHKKYLGLDEPTDVLSFVLERSEDALEGEVVVSAETAAVTGKWYGLSAADELLLYVIHGTLHLVGYDDTTPEEQTDMRRQETSYLARFGVRQRSEEARPASKRSAAEERAEEREVP